MTRHAQAIAVLVLIFVLGGVTGYLLARPGRREPRPPLATQSVAPYEQLGLTDAQRDRLEAVMASARPATERLLDSIELRLRAHLDSVEAAIRATFEPSQLRMLDSLRDAGAMLEPGMKVRRPAR